MEADAGGERWTASTNWIVARGLLRDTVSFESSADEGPTPTSGGLLLLRPPSGDPPPCEVTVCFRGKHEIHRVYARSAARVYEIYYSSDEQSNSKEYLCTVRCEASSNKMKILREADGATNDSNIGGNDGIFAVPVQMTKADSSSSDEDGWVEVKITDSLRDNVANSLPKAVVKEISTNLQMFYEATADISDASPCLSLTLRFLSLQTQDCVCIEEIYIYADPVESNTSASPIIERSLGENSLFAMLAPSLLQLSKSGSRRNVYDDSRVRKYPYDADKAADTCKLDMEQPHCQNAHSGIAHQESGPAFEVTKTKPEDTQSSYSHCVSDNDQMPRSVQEENNLADTRVVKLLDELVSRVDRIEAFCSRFEENMLRPISCIDGRLQRLEQQIETFLMRSQSCNSTPSLRMSAPEFSSDESDLEDKGCSPSHTVREDPKSSDLLSPLTDMTASVPAPQIFPSLSIKAPEFSIGDDEDTNNDNSDSDVEDSPKDRSPSFDSYLANTDDTPDPEAEDLSKHRKQSLMNDALASALAALMSSTTIGSPESPKSIPSLMAKPSETVPVDDNVLGSSSAGATSELAVEDLSNCLMENNGCNLSDEVKRSSDFDDSLQSADHEKAPLFDTESFREMLFTDPDDPNEHGDRDPIVCNDNNSSVPEVNDGLFTSGLAATLSSSTAESVSGNFPKRESFSGSQTWVDDVSDSFNSYDNKLAASSARVPHEESYKSGMEEHGITVNCDVELDSAFKFLFPKETAARREQDGIELRYARMEVPAERASPNCMSSDKNLGQQESNIKHHEQETTTGPTKIGVFTDCILDSILKTDASQKWHDGGWADGSDAEDATDPILNLHGRGWIDDSSSDSSVETFMMGKIQIDWSDDSSTDSIRGGTTVNQCHRQAADIHTSSQPIIGTSVNHCDLGELSAGDDWGNTKPERKCLFSMLDFCSLDKSRCGLEPDVTGLQDHEYSILDVKFSQESNWKGQDPFEVLLGAVSGAEEQITAVNADNAAVSSLVDMDRHNSSPLHDAEKWIED